MFSKIFLKIVVYCVARMLFRKKIYFVIWNDIVLDVLEIYFFCVVRMLLVGYKIVYVNVIVCYLE